MSQTAYVGFGANLGDPIATFEAVIQALQGLLSTKVKARSGLYETEPVGISDDGPSFINAVIAVETELSPAELMAALKQVELRLGKSRTHRSDLSRLVDLDLLLFGGQCFSVDGLVVPHPRMHDRAFVLVPLAEVAGTELVPSTGATVTDLLDRLPEHERNSVKLIPGKRFSG